MITQEDVFALDQLLGRMTPFMSTAERLYARSLVTRLGQMVPKPRQQVGPTETKAEIGQGDEHH